ncbi:helix-turn-helix domain-containing protein [Bythopirellula goksoeyrii]|uniref:Helix-turn-helix domain protein n=1 Tax=Bythopirellula goksoeyrii TaxID=1400387 RepID=A0A5B9QIB8_9BACT|nr:helix-turn-helix domain-containing protein [Bythopirellula goksoeyrii]QEG37729.1 Helix-turn-helix domain protein [Bythopirellula goksoeyrii]
MDDPIGKEIEAAARAIATMLRSTITQTIREFLAENGASRSNPRQGDFASVDNHTCKLYTGDEVADLLGVSRRHVHSLTKNGKLPSVRLGTRVRYRQSTLAEWLAQQEATPQQARHERTTSNVRKTTSASKSRTVKELARKSNAKADCSSKSNPRGKPQQADNSAKEFVGGLQILARSLGVDYESLPRMTNGDIRRIADVEIAILHGWQYLGRELPPEALENVTKWLRNQGSKSSNKEQGENPSS